MVRGKRMQQGTRDMLIAREGVQGAVFRPDRSGRHAPPGPVASNRFYGSVAGTPAWMMHELAAHHQLRAEPRLSLDLLR